MTFKTLRRRGASLFLALTMCVSLLQVPAYAVDEAEEAAPDINVTVVSMNDAASTGDTTTPAPETTTPESTAPEASTPEETEEFDLADTQRPEQTDDISVAPGAPEEINPPETPDEPETPSEPETPVTPEDPSEPVPPAEPENPGEVEEPGNTEVVKPQDKNWDIFYDAERDVYKVTFKIDEDAEATEQVIDLTQALELLGQYAQLGKQEMEQAKAELEKQKPVMPSIEEPTMPDVTVPEPTKPEKPVAPDAPQKPDEPQKPTEPGMTNELKASLDQADSAFLAYVANDNRLSTKDNAEEFLREQGLDTSDKYVQSYAKYLVEKADAMDARNALEANNDPDYVAFIIEYYSPSGYWDDDGNRVTYTQAERLELAKADLDKTINNVPEYKVDKDSQAYKDYETALEVYNEKMEEYQAKLNEYKAAQDAYEKEHGVNSPEYKAYLAQMAEYEAQLEQYTTAKAEAAAQYAADIAAYLVKLANLQAKYDNDMNAYNAAVKELNEKYTSWAEANVLQPGDIRKFELFLTSDSKHTYKYQSGSFTLATPDLKPLYEQLGIKTDGLIIGFDGQELGGTDLRPVEASVSYMSKPMLDLFDKAGIPREEVGVWLKSHDFRDVLTGWYDSTTVEQESALHELLGIEKGFSNEELRTAVEQWVIGYYSKDGTT